MNKLKWILIAGLEIALCVCVSGSSSAQIFTNKTMLN